MNKHSPDCRDKQCSGCGSESELSVLRERVKELEAALKGVYDIVRWRHCQDDWHKDYHSVVGEANTFLSDFLKKTS